MDILNGELSLDNGMIVTLVVLVSSFIAVRAFAMKILEKRKSERLQQELRA